MVSAFSVVSSKTVYNSGASIAPCGTPASTSFITELSDPCFSAKKSLLKV